MNVKVSLKSHLHCDENQQKVSFSVIHCHHGGVYAVIDLICCCHRSVIEPFIVMAKSFFTDIVL